MKLVTPYVEATIHTFIYNLPNLVEYGFCFDFNPMDMRRWYEALSDESRQLIADDIAKCTEDLLNGVSNEED